MFSSAASLSLAALAAFVFLASFAVGSFSVFFLVALSSCNLVALDSGPALFGFALWLQDSVHPLTLCPLMSQLMGCSGIVRGW